jgi:hypothetical protein
MTMANRDGDLHGSGGWQTANASFPFMIKGLETGGDVALKFERRGGSFWTFTGRLYGHGQLNGMLFRDTGGAGIPLYFTRR